MTTHDPRATLDRLRAITWDDDVEVSLRHARSRALLMREYLRRAAHWARAYDANAAWPFFDLAGYVDPSVAPDAALCTELDDYLRRCVGTPSIQAVCRGAVRWAAVRRDTRYELPAIPEMYEPLLLMFERGGGYSLGQFIDLHGVAIRRGKLDENLSATPFLTLAPTTLAALDGRGRITYYAKTGEGYPRSSPRGIVRRRLVGSDDEMYDEAFTRNLRWEPTEYLRRYDLGHNDIDHVRISEAEAAAFVESVINTFSGGHRPSAVIFSR